MELLQYEPQTPQVHAAPLLCSPPWINKYYVMDLAPGRSFIEWAVQHGRTVFAISYRNPDAEMSGVTLDDYLIHGPRTALDVIQDITGAETIDIVGLCLGGALTVDHRRLPQRPGRQPGRHADAAQHDGRLHRARGPRAVHRRAHGRPGWSSRWPRRATCAASRWPATFDVLRANDLIFNYVVSNWLLGQEPPAFDILAWNADSTRMPAAMHSFYLRNFYVENKLAKDELEMAGQRHRPRARSSTTTYVVSADNDHIVPWRSAYQTTQLRHRPVPVRALQRRPHRRHRQPARAQGRGTCVADELPPNGGRVARGRHAPGRLVVGGLGGVVGRALGTDGRPAAHGQQAPPGDRAQGPGEYVHT